ncbi:hypothetical protein [uncultured Stenotrophomonas sp.]|uniref:hypothetical protein n=1 Tax=uncultured Stenotrophomonas sp. TaxID=165438 RepID=UPI0025F76935|nr:hypothetical protein [uncultured Stenotrophomonas sp.]
MDLIEKRARELLLSHYSAAGFQQGDPLAASDANTVAIKAIATALTPPDGFVLVNHTQLRQLLRDVVTASDFVGGRAQSKPLARRLVDQAWALIEAPGSGACPEVVR